MTDRDTSYKIVLLRHGESEWNKANKFTGWYDAGLSDQGVGEAHFAAEAIKEAGLCFDVAYTSVLKRAIKTLWLVMEDLDLMYIPVIRSWKLNERNYGGLQGLNKAETAAKFGEEQVLVWRRSFDVPPPELEESDERFPGHDAKYRDVPRDLLPKCESLKITIDRVVPYWEEVIAPDVRSGRNVIIAAHGNSLRALVKYLDELTPDEILKVDIPTGVPLVYELDANLKPVKHYYLADEEKLAASIAAVKAQGKAKE